MTEDTPTLRECAECRRDEIDGCDEPVHEDYPLCWVHARSHCWSCSLAARDDERESGLRGNW